MHVTQLHLRIACMPAQASQHVQTCCYNPSGMQRHATNFLLACAGLLQVNPFNTLCPRMQQVELPNHASVLLRDVLAWRGHVHLHSTTMHSPLAACISEHRLAPVHALKLATSAQAAPAIRRGLTGPVARTIDGGAVLSHAALARPLARARRQLLRLLLGRHGARAPAPARPSGARRCGRRRRLLHRQRLARGDRQL